MGPRPAPPFKAEPAFGVGAAYLFLASSSLLVPILRSLRWSEPDPVGFQTSVTAKPVPRLEAFSLASHLAHTMDL